MPISASCWPVDFNGSPSVNKYPGGVSDDVPWACACVPVPSTSEPASTAAESAVAPLRLLAKENPIELLLLPRSGDALPAGKATTACALRFCDTLLFFRL